MSDSGICQAGEDGDQCKTVFGAIIMFILLLLAAICGAFVYRRWRRKEYLQQLTQAIGYPVIEWTDAPSSSSSSSSSSSVVSSDTWCCYFGGGGDNRDSGDGCLFLLFLIILVAVVGFFAYLLSYLLGSIEPHFKVKHPIKPRTYAKVLNTRTAFIYNSARYTLVSQLRDQIHTDFAAEEPSAPPQCNALEPPPPPYTPPV